MIYIVIHRVWRNSRKQSCGSIAIAFRVEFRKLSYGGITKICWGGRQHMSPENRVMMVA
jgi:hypothetical protein